MHKYRVIENHSDLNWVLLEGAVGHFHWVRLLNATPRVGDILCGSRPHLGFGLLYDLESGFSYRLVFETINDTDRSFNLAWLPEVAPGNAARP